MSKPLTEFFAKIASDPDLQERLFITERIAAGQTDDTFFTQTGINNG